MQRYLKNLNKKRIILSFILSIGCFAACYLFSGSFLKSAVLASCFAIIGCIQIRIPAVFCVPVTLASFFITGAGSLFLSQFVQNEGFASLIGNAALEGLCCCTFFTCILYVIFPSIRFSTIGVAGITLFLSTANWFVYHFRGSEIVPIDLISLGTAMNVANQYNFTITANIVYS